MKLLNRDSITVGTAAIFLVTLGAFGLLQTPEQAEEPPSISEGLVFTQATSLLPIASPETPSRVARTMNVVVTAYSSTPEQTDDTPFITASGNWVRDGIVATNLLPLGTKIKIPDIYGDRVFIVDDRMHPRMQVHVDVWFASYWDAKKFGKQNTYIEVLES